jgi:hypothetical protein
LMVKPFIYNISETYRKKLEKSIEIGKFMLTISIESDRFVYR